MPSPSDHDTENDLDVLPVHIALPTSYDGTVSDPEPYNPSLAMPTPSSLLKTASNSPPKKRNKRGYLLFPDEPPFKKFLKDNWLDLITMLVCDVVASVLVFLVPLPFTHYQLFPITEPQFMHPASSERGSIVNPEIAYPYLPEIISTLTSAIVCFLVPFFTMLLISVSRIRSFDDFNSAAMGLGYALSVGTLFQAVLKLLVGGLRPHFLSVCEPSLTGASGSGFKDLYFTPSVCKGNHAKIRNALQTFPSGHAVAAFAGFGFLAIWLNAKFKIFANRQTRCWHLLLFMAPLLIAAWIGASKRLDRHHHHNDILVGAWIGKLMAVKAYRMRYAAVLDWRYNHVPLTRQGLPVHEREWDVERRFTAIESAGWLGKRGAAKAQ
ncbi:acid phosphatase/Vanadium-dependent haloperoxidase [Polyplosphaeria fusca]|uniref:Acid phosphatase/Vanadium-dependent haloperoxidase n=1 Tax=Polyplosphaeria fusca TaxID=682080 RepID=A0A9P4R5S0_9PLEO|nr:acid phosphatase/Vanadium-dependent haloperoxidase [Polyplosphaeria fusca]